MRHLLDVNLLICGILENHPNHAKALAWIDGKNLVVCPVVETGFLRIASGSKINLKMEDSRTVLKKFLQENKVEWIPDDLRALESHPKTSNQVTDHYLADLAAKHGLKLATLDGQIKHPAVELVN